MKVVEAIQRFGEYQRNVLGRSENTISSYRLDLMKFIREAGIEDLDNLTKNAVESYIGRLATEGMAATTRSRKLSALQSMCDYLVQAELMEKNPVASIPKPKLPQKKVLAMDAEEVHKVLETAESQPKHKNYFRNLTLVNLLFGTGLRRDELVNIKLTDVDIAENSLLVRVGKGNKQRIVYYNDTVKYLLSEWIAAHRKIYGETAKHSAYLFVSDKSEKLSPETVNQVVNKILVQAGLKDKGFTVHSARKAFATAVYRATKDVVTVQHLLGHTNPQTTMRCYIGIDEESKRNAAQMISF